MISDNKVLPIHPAYSELSQLIFMLQMSYINPSSIDVSNLKIKIDNLISFIHANNILEKSIKL